MHSERAIEAWCALTASGATAIGVKEEEYINVGLAIPSFPRDYLDSPAGVLYWQEEELLAKTVDFRRPKSKRVITNSKSQMSTNNFLFRKYFDLDESESAPSPTSSQSNNEAINVSDEVYDEKLDNIEVTKQCGFLVPRVFLYLKQFYPSITLLDNESLKLSTLSLGLSPWHHQSNVHRRKIKQPRNFFNKNEHLGSCRESPPRRSRIDLDLEVLIPEIPPMLCPIKLTVFISLVHRGRLQSGAAVFKPTFADYVNFLSYRSNRMQLRRLDGKRVADWRGRVSDMTFTATPQKTFRDATLSQTLSLTSTDSHSTAAATLAATVAAIDDEPHTRETIITDRAKKCPVISSEATKSNDNDNDSISNSTRDGLLGFITSVGDSCMYGKHVAIGLCSADLLHNCFREATEMAFNMQSTDQRAVVNTHDLYQYSDDHLNSAVRLVMVKNPTSPWLRPAILHVLSFL